MTNRIRTVLSLSAGTLLLVSLTVGLPLTLIGQAALAAFPGPGV